MRKLSESVWMDIHKQSNGDIERIEDDIEGLNPFELCSYINKRYMKQPKTISGSSAIKYDTEINQIGIPLLIWKSADIFYVALVVDGYAKNIFLSLFYELNILGGSCIGC